MSGIWIDTDCGFDDLAAIAMVHHGGPPIVGLSLVAGNAPLDVVTGNARRIAAFLGLAAPLHAGRAGPILGSLVTAQDILGADAMGGMAARLPQGADIAIGTDAVGALVAALDRTPAPLDILALGPLTNLAIALLLRPDLAARIGRLVWMGGSAAGGNHTAAAEFNAAVDPEAVAIVLESGVRLRMVGLDACRQVTVTRAEVDALRIRGGARASLAADLLDAYLRIASPDGTRPMALYDPTAAAALLDGEAMSFAPAHVAAVLERGPARGMTVCEFRARKAPPNAEVARQAVAPRIIDRCLTALAGDLP